MKKKKDFKCLVGFHKWHKLMSQSDISGKVFMEKYVCKKCMKIKELEPWI